MNLHETEMIHLEALHTQARARRRSVEALVDRLAANLPPLETRSKKEAPSMTTTITSAQFRQYSPWYRAGKLGEETIFGAGHNPAYDTVLISAAEYQHHSIEVEDQDAKIEAYKREVMGLPAPEPDAPAEPEADKTEEEESE